MIDETNSVPEPASLLSMTSLDVWFATIVFSAAPLARTRLARAASATVTLKGDPGTCLSDHVKWRRYAPITNQGGNINCYLAQGSCQQRVSRLGPMDWSIMARPFNWPIGYTVQKANKMLKYLYNIDDKCMHGTCMHTWPVSSLDDRGSHVVPMCAVAGSYYGGRGLMHRSISIHWESVAQSEICQERGNFSGNISVIWGKLWKVLGAFNTTNDLMDLPATSGVNTAL